MNSLVPDGWKQLEVRDAFDLGRGRVISKPEIRDNPGVYPVYSSQSKNNGKMGSLGSFDFDGEYITWTTDGAYAGTVFHRKGRFNCTNVCGTLKDKGAHQIHPRFVARYLETVAKNHVSYVGNPKLMNGTFAEIIFLLPPLPEQQKIADILTSVDNVIETTQAQIDKLKDLKTGMMQELLTKGIGHSEFKDSPVGRIPVGWEVKPLEAVVENVIDCEHKTAPYVERSDYLVVRTNNVRSGVLLYNDMKFTTKSGFDEWTTRAVPLPGNILFTREAPAGESCMVPSGVKVCLGQRMVLLKSNFAEITGAYLSLYLNSDIAKLLIYELSIGTTVSRINIQDIKKINCIVPQLKEQKSIVDAVESVQMTIARKERKLKSIVSSKKALMQDLLTGTIRVKVDSK
ncbi:MAG: restriction endonuclease subunit S [Deltaproteobacteria bacterium]|nr:restriction endonuclease subunit S [Deltaproteobacteria bacterium]